MTNQRFNPTPLSFRKEDKSILYLDDMRTPLLLGVDVVRNYQEFVTYIKALRPGEFPDLISFDHDLSLEHYPFSEADHFGGIPYGTYREKTGLDCARYIVDNLLPIRYWTVHSHNPVGKKNIENELRNYRKEGWLRQVDIPFRIDPIEGVSADGYRHCE